MTEQTTDADLISRYYRAADNQALAKFVQKHRCWAITRARRYVSEDEAEDVVQASIIRLMSAQPVGGRVTNPLGWWHTVIAATAKDLIRESSRRLKREQSYARDLSLTTQGPQSESEDKDLVDAIYEEIHRTDTRFRDPLLKRYFEDLSYDEIARELDLRPGTVASRLARGIERVRAALGSKGIYVPTQLSETAQMRTDSRTTNDTKAFVERWKDAWFVSMHSSASGIGHITTKTDAKGSVALRFRLDIAVDNPHSGDPRESPNRVWLENEFAIEDVHSFTWSTIRAKEGATDAANTLMAERGMHYDQDELIECVENGAKLSIHSRNGTTTLDVAGGGPLIPDLTAALYVCQLPPDANAVQPIRLICFERSMTGRQWSVLPSEARYAGRSGPPVGLSHTFELDMKAYAGRNGYIWMDDKGAFIGMGDERESFIKVEDENSALEMFQHRS